MWSPEKSPATPSTARRVAAFAIAAGVVLWYAVPEGSYDIVRRQENGIAVWWVVGLGGALGLLPRARLRRESLLVLLALALLVAWTALALTWTSSEERTLAEVVRTVHYAGIVLLVWCVVSPSTWRPAAAGLAAAAIAVCGLAVASRLAPETFDDEVAKAFGITRLSYPLGYWNAVASWGGMSATMALVWSAHARSLAVRAASLAAVPLAVLTVYLTYSRAGVGGIAVGLAAAVALSVNRWTVAVHALAAAVASAVVVKLVHDRPEIADGTGTEGAPVVLQSLAGAAVLCGLAVVLTWLLKADDRWRLSMGAARAALVSAVVVGLVGFAVLGRAPASEAWDEFRNGGVAATSSDRLGSFKGSRYEVWSSAVDALKDAPLEGIGPGTFEFHWNRDEGGEFLRDAHSVYLEQAAEIGLPGVLLTLAALLGLGALGVLARFRLPDPSRAGAAAAVCAAFVVYLFHAGLDWMWEATAVSVLALVGVAIASGPLTRPRATAHLGLRVALPVLAVCACVVALPGLRSTTKVRSSQQAFRDGDPERAREEADAAVSRQRSAATPYVQRGLVRWAAGDRGGAARDLRSAREREPLDWRHAFLLSRVEAERGRTGMAIRAFREAKRLRPASAFFITLPPAPPAVPRTGEEAPAP